MPARLVVHGDQRVGAQGLHFLRESEVRHITEHLDAHPVRGVDRRFRTAQGGDDEVTTLGAQGLQLFRGLRVALVHDQVETEGAFPIFGLGCLQRLRGCTQFLDRPVVQRRYAARHAATHALLHHGHIAHQEHRCHDQWVLQVEHVGETGTHGVKMMEERRIRLDRSRRLRHAMVQRCLFLVAVPLQLLYIHSVLRPR